LGDSHRDLIAWRKAMALVTEIYRATDTFPSREMYGLTRQIREAAVSVPSNIAEGKGRQTKRDYLQFLYRARGSLLEVQTQLEVGCNLGFLDELKFGALFEQAAEVGRILNGLITNVRRQVEDGERQRIPRPPKS
jgi:four helix bundle protein